MEGSPPCDLEVPSKEWEVKGTSPPILLGSAALFFLLALGASAMVVVQILVLPESISDLTTVVDGNPVLAKFTIPSPSLYFAVASGCLGVAALCCHSWWVLGQPKGNAAMADISTSIQQGAYVFLFTEFRFLVIICLLVFVLCGILVGDSFGGDRRSWSVAVCYLVGAALSALSGLIGMITATSSNARTAAAAFRSLGSGLQVAFRAGVVMGLCVVSLGVIGVAAMLLIFEDVVVLAGFSFGASSVAIFARVGGGIYTKAADVGADLFGKVEEGIPEDDARNPATIADNVGDNVGDVAGMGSDLFESFVGSIIAAVILGARQTLAYPGGEEQLPSDVAVAVPFIIAAVGILGSVVGTVHIRCREDSSLTDLLKSMRSNVFVASFLIVLGCAVVCICLSLTPLGMAPLSSNLAWRIFGCVLIGLVCGFLIGLATEFFTSNDSAPTRSIAMAAEFGAGPVVIQGLGLGMLSSVVPSLLIAASIVSTYKLLGFFGTSVAAVGMLSTLGVTMATDAYGPVADNAGGIAEMASLPDFVRDRTDRLDALGNTTAATGKGFANGSAVLAALCLLSAFTFEVRDPGDISSESETPFNVYVIDEFTIVGMLLGALLPFSFAALTMLAVGRSAQAILVEVRRQFREIPGLRDGIEGARADYSQCVGISTVAALREMILPAVTSILSPLCVGLLMGLNALVGMLAAAVITGYLLGVTMNNAGGSWDNAKKFSESGKLTDHEGVVRGKGSEWHKALVTGDTIGDPCKDTSGPSLNILIKLMTVFALVFTPLFKRKDDVEETVYAGIVTTTITTAICIFFFFWLRSEANKLTAAHVAHSTDNKKVADTNVATTTIPATSAQGSPPIDSPDANRV